MTIWADDSVLLLIDFQEKLMPAMHDGTATVACASMLARAARLLKVPVVVTEHQADKIGPTVPALDGLADLVFPKIHFSAIEEPGFGVVLPPERSTFLLAGWEAHVCVLQTALGLRVAGHRVVLLADGSSSRRPVDHAIALQRAQGHGIEIATAEMVLFEWLHHCENPKFRDVLALIKQR
ncbi:isochorismatase family protein [Corticimicrobacter populi]|uniref:Isochorismatase n=1 Tax=Corticimicrobacter populi TaxID=2175229 RepID=A0A2V1K240_9BURK|nr:isochorismatase family protein [Corticimicrobacter populi]PWF22981.1 isochorismatase [Corticimicrobacter populi]